MTSSLSLKTMIAIAALSLLPASTGPTFAQKNAGGGVGPVAKIGGRDIALVVPAGHCALERANPSDKRVIELVEKLLAGRNALHLTTTDCKELDDWRAGRRENLGEYTQTQSHIPLDGRDFRGQESQLLKEICAQTRKQGGAIAQTVEADIQKRLQASREQIQLQNVSMLGALDEDQHGCYVGMLIKLATEQGKSKTQLCVFANVILQGKLVYLYRYSERLDEAEVKRLLAERKATARAHVEANG